MRLVRREKLFLADRKNKLPFSDTRHWSSGGTTEINTILSSFRSRTTSADNSPQVSKAVRASSSEFSSTGFRPGVVFFSDIAGIVTNLTNHPARMTTATPLVVDATALLQGAGRLDVTIRIPLLSPTMDFSYQASVGPMDPTVLNDMLVPVQGAMITAGQIDSTWVEGTVTDGRAEGTLAMVYRDLAVNLVRKETEEPDVLDDIVNFVIRVLVVEKHNPSHPELPVRVAPFAYTRQDQDPFVGFVWKGIRRGIVTLLIRD